jgi:5-methylcytosine-specific restriction endonuclease McrA
MKTLVLTPWMSPFLIVPWQTAITMMHLGKVDLLEQYNDEVCSSPSVSMPMPAVLRLRRAISGFKHGVKFSRGNVLTRDRHTCQYCGVKKRPEELNYDHVVPRKLGGRTIWENIVASCFPCNTRKGGRTPEQAGMKLRTKPVRPHTLPLASLTLDERKVPPLWVPYAQAAAASGIYGERKTA